MNCSGTDVATNEEVAIEFGHTITSVKAPESPGRSDFYLAPGLIDLQVNGFAGVDFNRPETTLDDLDRALGAILATGVTRCLPTVITGSPDAMLASLSNLRRAQRELPRGAAIAGFHVEGPHLGADDGPRGAHPAQWMRPPDLTEFDRWQAATQNNIRLVTISPHWANAPKYIAALKDAGVTVSIGHTSADGAQITAAVEAGATLSTHLGNAAYRLLPKFPNCLWDQLAEDRLSASFIVDGIHLDDAFLRTALRGKSIERSLLVTDAAAPAGAPPGRYHLGELDVDLTEDDRVVLAGTRKLAGSALRMDKAIANVMCIADVDLRSAVQMATLNPARAINLKGRMRGLIPGDKGDVVVFRKSLPLEVEAVYLEGTRVA